MVVAFGRSEVTETFPNLWTASEALQLPLGRLSPRASERLVRSALGSSLADDVVARLVERANGNPFYLEELIRREAEGGSDTLPETVLALVQSRLERLEPPARRIVRAASVFGETFWDQGVAAVLGQAAETGDLGGWLETLVAREVLTVQPDARFPGTRQYAFHHGMLRDAAYAMLTDADRPVGHRLAGEWLESVHESDPLAIAEHFERGDAPRAAHWLRQAAQLAYDGAHLEAAWALAARGLACSPGDTDRLHLLGIYGAARAVRGQWRESVDSLREAFALSPVGEAHWYAMGAGLMAAGSFVGDPALFISTLQAILGVTTQPEPSGPYGMAIENVCTALSTVGQYDMALEVLARAEGLAQATPDPDPAFVLWLLLARAHIAAGDFEPGHALAYLAKAAPLLEHTGDVIGRNIVTMIRAQTFGHVGRCDLTEAAVRDLSSAGPNVYQDMVKILHAGATLVAGRITETISVARSMLDPPMPITSVMARTLLALALSETRDVDAAETEANALLNAEGPVFAGHRFAALTALARTALTRGSLDEALVYADQALEAAPIGHTTVTYVVCLRARVLHELGRHAEACSDIESARNDILRIASTIEDPEMRESFLTCPTVNGIVLQLAEEWLD
jgi:tetratricopeptide (TPR) repeat protein